MVAFLFAECCAPACDFRFVAQEDDPRRERCPRCGAATRLTAARPGPPESGAPAPAQPPIVALLDNIRSTHNVGSMFRTADGAGLAHLHLCGITATPEHPRLAKAALGAHLSVPWSHHPNAVRAARALREQGHRLVALERTDEARLPSPAQHDRALALVVGNERAGVDPAVLALCDDIIALPMAGRKSSLNAAVAFGIAVYALRFGALAESPTGGVRG
jgi:tRNA G18 (ribose-2'-O)-methylase SpoU